VGVTAVFATTPRIDCTEIWMDPRFSFFVSRFSTSVTSDVLSTFSFIHDRNEVYDSAVVAKTDPAMGKCSRSLLFFDIFLATVTIERASRDERDYDST
jgi:hypothetical protein